MPEIINVRNIGSLAELTRVRCGWITQVAWSPDDTVLAVAGAEGVYLYIGEFGDRPRTLTGHNGHVKGAAFSPDGLLLASVSADTTVKLWDVSTIVRGKVTSGINEVATLRDHNDSVDAVMFSPDGRTLVTGSADGLLYLWDVPTRKRKAVLEGHKAEVASVMFALGGHIVVSAGRDNKIYLWDVSAETRGTIVGEHEDWVREIHSNPAGTIVASASKDSTVRLWDTYSGDLYATVHAHEGGVDSVAFSPDGTLMATGGRDNLVRIWYVQKALGAGEVGVDDALITLSDHEKPVLSLAFNPSGRILASGSGDNTVRLWSTGESSGKKPDISRTTSMLTPFVDDE